MHVAFIERFDQGGVDVTHILTVGRAATAVKVFDLLKFRIDL